MEREVALGGCFFGRCGGKSRVVNHSLLVGCGKFYKK